MENIFKFKTSLESYGFGDVLELDPSVFTEDDKCTAELTMTCTINFGKNGINSIWWAVNEMRLTVRLEAFTDEITPIDLELLSKLPMEQEDCGDRQIFVFEFEDDSFEGFSITINTERQNFNEVEIYWNLKEIIIS